MTGKRLRFYASDFYGPMRIVDNRSIGPIVSNVRGQNSMAGGGEKPTKIRTNNAEPRTWGVPFGITKMTFRRQTAHQRVMPRAKYEMAVFFFIVIPRVSNCCGPTDDKGKRKSVGGFVQRLPVACITKKKP